MKFSKQELINIIKEEIKETMGMGVRSSRDIMIGNISDMFKDMHGVRPRHYNWNEMTDKDLEALEAEISAEYDDWYNEERVQDDLEDMYIQSEKELMSFMDLEKAEKEREAQRQLMMTPEEGEEFPTQSGMGKKLTKRNMRYRMEEMYREEYINLLLEMFGDSIKVEKGDEYYHQRFPDMMNYGVVVQDADSRTVLLKPMGDGFKVKRGQKFRMAKDIFLKSFIQKSNEIDPDTGKRINVINLSEGLRHHIDTATPLTDNIYRIGSDEYFNIIREARIEYQKGNYKPLNEEEEEMLKSNLGEWAEFEGESVPLDFPMYTETLEEKKKKKKKKDPPIGKPMKNTGGGKKYKVFVRNPKTGKIKKISYGDSKGGLKGNWNSAEARKSFASRHNCAEKKDRTKAGYWACRAHKDFGTNVPGRFW